MPFKNVKMMISKIMLEKKCFEHFFYYLLIFYLFNESIIIYLKGNIFAILIQYYIIYLHNILIGILRVIKYYIIFHFNGYIYSTIIINNNIT